MDLFRRRRAELLDSIVRWSSLDEKEADAILRKLESRTKTLDLRYPPGKKRSREMEIAALAVALAMDYAYTGRLA